MSPLQFWNFCDLLKGKHRLQLVVYSHNYLSLLFFSSLAKGLKDGRDMSIPSKALLFLARLRHNLRYEFLSIVYNITSKRNLQEAFWNCSVIHFDNSNKIPRYCLKT